MLIAMVQKDFRFPTVYSCAGREFVKYEYRQVPAGFEEEAKANPYLTTKEVAEEERVEIVLTNVEEVDATDSAIALANEKGVDLAEVKGSGVGGRILKSDVETVLMGGEEEEPTDLDEFIDMDDTRT